ncbi:hypothetical protein V8F20_005943 [Naviculisporaceae sp. PSN 640]
MSTAWRDSELAEVFPLPVIKHKQSPELRFSIPNNGNFESMVQETFEASAAHHRETRALEARIEALEAKLKEQKDLLRTLLEDGGGSGNLDSDDADCDTMGGEIRSQLLDHKRLMSCFGPVLCTRRGIMVLKSMQHHQQNHAQVGSKGGNGVDGFDQAMTISEVADISQALDARPQLLSPSSTCIRVCAVCNIPRFVKIPSDHTSTASQVGEGSEFSSAYRTTPCCGESICDPCLIRTIVSSFTKDWWFDGRYDWWLRCPGPQCYSDLPLYHQQVKDLLRQLGGDKSELYEAQFVHCLRLRKALSELVPRPTFDALQRAAALHHQLVSQGWMRDHTQVLNPVDIVSLSVTPHRVPVDSVDGTETLQVPVFVENIIHKGARECIVCAEFLPDVVDNDDDEERWTADIKEFPGHWPRFIRPFPSPDLLPICSASHPLNICWACLAQHVRTQLDSRGIDACESLGCPSPGCGHRYTHEEVRMLVPPDVFARYDKLNLLKALSAEPDFRWCLREGCENGQIHQILDRLGDGPLDRRRNHVECEECQFQMCFTHQIPWHRGLSCAEYDQMKAGMMAGDTNHQATQEWLVANTKMCRCGAYVQKRGGCFHMTCSSCRFEFCWECMADWKLIQGLDPETGRMSGYNRLAHAPDCYFRSETAAHPIQLGGDTLEDALR